MTSADVEARFRGAGLDARFDAGTRSAYTSDASLYRHLPVGVVLPRTAEEVVTAIEVSRELGLPVTTRAGGTSIAGQAANTTVVIDVSRHLHRVVDLDPVARTARVEPGLVLDDLRRAAAPHGLTFGPDPSTHSRCTLGGMIGNNSCGPRSLRWGKTDAHVRSLDVVTYRGERLRLGPRSPGQMRTAASRGHGVEAGLARLVGDGADVIRRDLDGTFSRRVSGYNLEALLPEHGGDLARALVGSEGTCAVVLEATVGLVPRPAATRLVVLGLSDMVAAATIVPAVLSHDPEAVEAIDRRIVEVAAAAPGGRRSVGGLPRGDAWLYLEFAGEDDAAALARAQDAAAALQLPGVTGTAVPARDAQQDLWRVRELGAGLSTRLPDGRQTWPGWEDAAVPPDRLAAYLDAFQTLCRRHGLNAVIYGHFGEGCVHTRIDFDFASPAGVANYRRFVEDAADLVVAHGGSLSGEHGDGQARGELLPRMYGPEILRLFRRFKAVWDPDNGLNPRRLIDADPLDRHLRVDGRLPLTDPVTFSRFPEDGDSLENATARCVGVARCRDTAGTGTMCPSYRATREEVHSTRGRARILNEMLQRDGVVTGWTDPHVHDALDLCLSCKACKAECPVSVDMAAYKAEYMHQYYANGRRPLQHHAFGHIRALLRTASRAPRLANAAGRSRLARRAGERIGITGQRPLPQLSSAPLRGPSVRAFRHDVVRAPRPAVLWVDTFTRYLEPSIAHDAATVIGALGFDVVRTPAALCCGRPYYDHGMLDQARSAFERTVELLRPALERDVPVVGLEPSCLSVLRDEAPRWTDDQDLLARLGTVTSLSEFVTADDGGTPVSGGTDEILYHPHCHEQAVMGTGSALTALEGAAASVASSDAGCCGMAGSFGFRTSSAEVSVAVANDRLVPTVEAHDGTVVADGFSCREQIRHLTGVVPLHSAQVLRRSIS